jgi:hypothetical protein
MFDMDWSGKARQPDNAERFLQQHQQQQHYSSSSTIAAYAQRRWPYCCCCCCCTCRPGETLDAERVDGSTMGMALRVRCAMGWCSLVCAWW